MKKIIRKLRKEWGDDADVQNDFGLSRSFIRQRAEEGQVVWSLVRGRGASRGKRLYSYSSIRQLIAAGVTEREAASTK
jgi:hypothetical protein